MARAFLEVTDELREAFLSAQEDVNVRALKISIVDEAIRLNSTLAVAGSPRDDFEGSLVGSLEDNAAVLVAFCAEDRLPGQPSKWILIAWVPDNSKVRDKMLYSSSREDLRKALGLGYFCGEYYANSKEDMTWDQFSDYINKDRVDGPLSMKEQLILEERALTHVESNVTKATAMGALPFSLTDDTAAALHDLTSSDGDSGVNWVEMLFNTSNEQVELVEAKNVNARGSLQAHVSTSDARFYAIRIPNAAAAQSSCTFNTFFIYSCPENTPVRLKMTMSSCKASVLAAAMTQGVAFDRNFEIRSADEVDDQIKAEREAEAGGGPGSASAVVTHAKPSRPGKGRAKVAKFKADDDA